MVGTFKVKLFFGLFVGNVNMALAIVKFKKCTLNELWRLTTPQFIFGFSIVFQKWKNAYAGIDVILQISFMAYRWDLYKSKRGMYLPVSCSWSMWLYCWFYLSARHNSKSAYSFLEKILNIVKKWQIPSVINTDKAATYGHFLSWLKREGKCSVDIGHRQIKYKNSVIECDHVQLKQIIRITLKFKSTKGLCHN